MSKASLKGPLAILPIPRPVDRKPKTILASAKALRFLISMTMAGHVDENDPANRPYMMQKRYKRAKESARPQMQKTAMVLPAVEPKIQVVAWYRSTREPMMMQPNTEARLKRMTVRDDWMPLAPRLRANDGR